MTERTVPRFSEPYIDGRSWEEYFNDLREEGAINFAHRADDTEPDDDLPESDFSHVKVIVPAHEVKDGWPRGLGTWRNRCLEAGWEVKVGCSIAHHATTYYKNGNLNKEAHDEEQWWLNAVKNGKYITVSYNIRDGQAYSANTVRQERGGTRNLSDAEMKELVTA